MTSSFPYFGFWYHLLSPTSAFLVAAFSAVASSCLPAVLLLPQVLCRWSVILPHMGGLGQLTRLNYGMLHSQYLLFYMGATFG